LNFREEELNVFLNLGGRKCRFFKEENGEFTVGEAKNWKIVVND